MKKALIAAGFTALALSAAPAMAVDVKLYPYAAKANYCPQGLQPVVLGGDISCGMPNTTVSYLEAKRHPVQRTRSHYRKSYMSNEMYGSKSPYGN